MVVTVFVHQVDTTVHPTIPPGWRWAVHLGGNPHDLRACLNAGWCPNDREAGMEGEAVGVAVVKALRLCGLAVSYAAVQLLERDPIPAGKDKLKVVG